MKNKTKRIIRYFSHEPLALFLFIVPITFTVVCWFANYIYNYLGCSPSLAHPLELQPDTSIMSLMQFISFWYFIIVVTFYIITLLYSTIQKSTSSEITYFEDINSEFKKCDDETKSEIINGILNTEKVKPSYVHIAPKCKEVKKVKSKLKEKGFAMITGGPGEGKSMAAYHAAYELKKEDNYHIYTLSVEKLENKTEEKIIDEILLQLGNIKSKKRLIIVDDAHKLVAIKQNLKEVLEKEAIQGNGKYIWIETEFYEEEKKLLQPDKYVEIDFLLFFEILKKNFYESSDPSLQNALSGRINGLESAIEKTKRGEIRDAWHFAFVASRGEEKLALELEDLNDPEWLTLFLISSHTVLSGELELSNNKLINLLSSLEFGWLKEDLKNSSFSAIIRSLQTQTQKRKSMIRIYDKSKHDKDYIASLHYNFARAVIRSSSLRLKLVDDGDLLFSIKRLLATDKKQKYIYIDVFSRDIKEYADKFFYENKDWLINFIDNILPEHLVCYSSLLKNIRVKSNYIYTKIINKIDVYKIAKRINNTGIGEFGQLAYFLNALGSRRDEMLEKLDFEKLAIEANRANAEQFKRLFRFLNALGSRRDEMLEKLDFEKLAIEANRANAKQFRRLANFLEVLDNRRDEIIEKLDFEKLAVVANHANAEQFEQLIYFLRVLGSRRDEMVEKLDFEKLAVVANHMNAGKFGQLAYFLNALGSRRDEMLEKLDFEKLAIEANRANAKQFRRLANFLEVLDNRRDEIIEKLDFEKLAVVANHMNAEQFEQLAYFLNALGSRRDEMLEKLDFEKLAIEANRANAKQFRQLAEFMDNLDSKKSEFSMLLDHNVLIQKVAHTGAHNIDGLTRIIAHLEERDQYKFIQKINWVSIIKKCPISFPARKIAPYLIENTNTIKNEIRKICSKHYAGAAKFFGNCNKIDPDIAKHIAKETIDNLVNTFNIEPTVYKGAGQLINTLNEIDPNLSSSFVTNNKVRKKIQQSINKHDWNNYKDDLKYLIEAFYRTAPNLWKEMINSDLISVDLSSLDSDDFDSIYTKTKKS